MQFANSAIFISGTERVKFAYSKRPDVRWSLNSQCDKHVATTKHLELKFCRHKLCHYFFWCFKGYLILMKYSAYEFRLAHSSLKRRAELTLLRLVLRNTLNWVCFVPESLDHYLQGPGVKVVIFESRIHVVCKHVSTVISLLHAITDHYIAVVLI